MNNANPAKWLFEEWSYFPTNMCKSLLHKSYYLAVASWKIVARENYDKNKLSTWTAICSTIKRKHISKADDNYSFPYMPNNGFAEVLRLSKWELN